LGNTVHVYNAIFALEIYKLNNELRLLDTTLAFSLESLNGAVHADYVTEYALTLGKSTQGVNNFKNNMQALTDKSKLLGSTLNKPLQDSLRLSKVYQLHSSLHERCIQLAQLVTNELNNEFGSLFQEKKYKELMLIAKEQQGD
jgi:histidine ammonia-lyase